MIKTTFSFATTFLRSNKSKKRIVSKEEVTPKVKRSGQGDDIHSQRLSKALSVDSLEDGQPNYRFNFIDRSTMKKLDLTQLNQVHYDNAEQFNIIPTLIDPLDEIIQKPGIYAHKDLKSHSNFNYLSHVYEDLDMNRFDLYVPPSKDGTLKEFAKRESLKYIVSTSTFSSLLSHIYYLISGFKSPSFSNVFEEFPDEPKKFMISFRKPTSNFLHKIDENLYALDSDPGLFEQDVMALLNVGKIMERQLTQTKEEFEDRYVNQSTLPPIEDYHRFMKLNNEICLRSQIDCRSKTKEGEQFVFEIKSRSTCPIRYDYTHYYEYLDYVISQYKGLHSSFEREYYDLIRGAFLKWAFQIKIGRMDGAFVAYHNLKEIQGYEYIKASEIYKRIFGTEDFAETVFAVGSKLSTTLFDNILDSIQEEYTTLKIGVYAQHFTRKLIIFVEIFKNGDYQNLTQRQKGINDEYDYYEKFPLTNKVLKFEMQVLPNLNGVPIYGPISFREGDQLGVNYRFRSLGQAEFKDYMNFLHDCYKHEELNLDLNYSGAWLKNL